MKTRSLRRAAALLLALALACSLLTLPAEAEEFSLTPSNKLEFEVGGTETILVNGASKDTPIFWSPENPSFVSLERDEDSEYPVVINVTGDKAGSGTFIFTVGEGSVPTRYTIKVTEKRVPVDKVTIKERDEDIVMLTGETRTLTATVEPNTATNKNVTWKSGDESVVTVDDNGKLIAVSPSLNDKYTPITVTTEDGGYTDVCYVYVEPAPIEVTVLPKNISITKSTRNEDIPTPTATVTGYGAEQGVEWYSNNEASVRVGRLTGVLTLTANAKVGDKVTIYARSVADPRKDDICIVSIDDDPTPKVESVTITSLNTDAYRYVDPGSTITLSAAAEPPEATESDRQIEWTSDHPEIAKVGKTTGVVTGVAPGKATITATAKGGGTPATREVETSGILLSYRPTGETTAESLTENSVVDIYQNHDITVLTELFGNAKGKQVTLDTSNTSVAGVDSSLRVAANFPGESIITATVTGTGFTAKFKVKVSEDVADAVSVTMGSSASYSFSNSDLLSLLDKRSISKAGGPLESVSSLKVSTENGVLYYGYTSPENPGQAVGGTQRFYYQPGQSQLALKNVSFVPLPGFNGTAIVDYNGTATNGTTFNGTIRITASASGDVTYTTEVNKPVAFAAEHFSAVCLSRNGQTIRYVNFSQPAASRGTLYYNYSPSGQYSPKVDSSTAYHVSGSPSIDGISFVPAENFSGTVNISYRCIDNSGAGYTGTVTVTVRSGNGTTTTGDVEYSTAQNQRQTFRAADFNSACRRIIGGTLDYIRFTDLPPSTAGILYLNYTNSSSTKVTTSRNYYRSSSPYISNISFVPSTNYNGTVTIPFTGANTSGETFSGTLVIHVDDSVGTIHYSTPQNQTVTFAAADFNDASRRINGTSLNYIRFTDLPRSSAGTLYLNYTSSSSTKVTTGQSFYRSSSPSISSVSFVPASGYSGTVTIPFTAYDDNGDSFSGAVTIQVSGTTAGTAAASSIRYSGSSAPVPFRASDFQNVCRMALGSTLSYVQFTSLPAVGQLSQNYSGPAQTGTGVNTVAHYGTQELDQISYLPKAEYQGTIYIPYTLYDTRGVSHSSSVEIRLSRDYNYSSFSDIASGYWASPSIEFLRSSGITNGYGDNTYRPAQSISRGEFTLMICRAFQFPTTGSSGFPDVPAGSTYAGAVASARNLGIVEGNNGLFQPDRPITRQSAMTMICRAMDAAGRAVPAADTGLLSSYSDGGRISSFARSSVASLVQMGVVRGDNSNRLNPSAAISRAEMAVILHRVLTR